MSPFSGESSATGVTDAGRGKDVFLGGLKLFLQRTVDVAEGIPDPIGKIVKAIAGTGVGIMGLLEVSERLS